MLGAYRSKLQQLPGEVCWSITESDRPRGRDLAVLSDRRATLLSFPAAPKETREAMIARLFLRWPTKATPEEVTCYAMDLAEFPAWAISKGISDIISGLVLKAPEYRPSSLLVRAAVAAKVEPMLEELGKINAVLGASVVPDDVMRPDAARRQQLAEEARLAIRGGVRPMEAPPKRHARLPSRFDDAHSPDRKAFPSLSPEALSKMGVQRQAEAAE